MFIPKDLTPDLVAVALIFSASIAAGAGSPLPIGDVTAAANKDVETSAYDRIWSYATLYQNDENPVIQKLVFTGRAQADAAFFDSNQGDYDRLAWRRLRLGLKTTLFDDFTFHVEADINANDLDFDDLDDAYGRLTDFYIGWSRDDSFTIKAGKQSAPFTLDGATSSKKLLALERSTVATNLWFPTEYFAGVAALGEIGPWGYHLGGYSSSDDDEFGTFDSGYFGLASLGYDFAEQTGLDASLVRLDYVYNNPDYSGGVGTRDLRHTVTLASKFESGPVGLWSDLSFGDGIGDQSDIFGLELMPFYDITDKAQAVFRYTYVTGSGDPGVWLNRYESRITSDRFDDAHEFFLGLNYYLYGHKLKWQNGVEYTTASGGDNGGYDGWGFTSGVRLSW